MNDSKFINPDLSGSRQNMSNSRRSFIKKATAASVVLAGTNLLSFAADGSVKTMEPQKEAPWFKRVKRWGQINITLDTAANFDIAWWRSYWKSTQTQGIVLNAGGIYAYYPTKVPHHYRAPLLGDHDLFGDLCKAAHEDGLVVFARMDSGTVPTVEFYNAHPDWFSVDAQGKPFITDGRYRTCVNGPYYNEHIPAILTEIATMYHPEGFTDNSWAGLGINTPCYCENCKKSFRDKTGKEIPKKNWDDQVFRQWMDWNYKRRSDIWDLFTSTSKAAGGPNCTWSGMTSGSVISSGDFRDLKELCDRADIIMLDHQSRSDSAGFQQNAEAGKYIHGLLGWDKVAAESMAIYGPRLASKAAAESQMWMYEGIAGGIAPWWHTVSGYHEDRRRYETVPPVYQWHKSNEEFLYDRTPVATVGVVWSQGNSNWFGRDDTNNKVELPWRGIMNALVRARIPFVPVNADHIDRDAAQLASLVLPNFGAMTDAQVESVKRFVKGGGGLLATGESSLYDKYGDRRSDYALGDIFGAHVIKQDKPSSTETSGSNSSFGRGGIRSLHTYLRLTPELGRNVDGPHNGEEPLVTGERHPVFKGFDKTDIIPFGGSLDSVRTDSGAQVLLTFIPMSPTMPPEDAWMRVLKTDIQGLILNSPSGGGRVAFMPADIDRQFASTNYPDHGDLLENIIRWISKDNIPLVVDGAGLVDCNIYHQPGRMILHIANLVSAGTWRQPIDEFVPIGPVSVKIKLTKDVQGKNVNMLVSGQKITAAVANGWCQFKINSIASHEVMVIT
jgi:hypothetical protein